MTIEGKSEGEIRSWKQAKTDSEQLIKKHGNHPLVQLAKGVIPGVGIIEGASGEDLLTEKKLTKKERFIAGLGEVAGMAVPLPFKK